MRNITFISDTHGSHEDLDKKLRGGWMLIHSGDVSGWGKSKEIRGFIQWLSSLPYKHKIFIAGNHDEALQKYGIEHFNLPMGVHYLQDSSITIDGVKIWGSPYVPRFGNWYFMRDRGEEMRRKWINVPDDTDILVVHGPPFNTLDIAVIYKNREPVGREHVGCRDLTARINVVKPKIVSFGHIHNAYGKRRKNGILFINSSSLDHKQIVSNAPVIVDYDKLV